MNCEKGIPVGMLVGVFQLPISQGIQVPFQRAM
jgi:hypothetical protein